MSACPGLRNDTLSSTRPLISNWDGRNAGSLEKSENALTRLTERFKQWVLEDTFSHGRPPLEEVGVQIVPDVHPYETMKLRLLNGSHQAMAYLGYLAGYRYVHEAMADPDLRRLVVRMMDEEITPLLPLVRRNACVRPGRMRRRQGLPDQRQGVCGVGRRRQFVARWHHE